MKRLTVSVEEAAEMLGISRALAYSLVRREELPSIKLGRRLVVPLAALLRLIEVPAEDDLRARHESGSEAVGDVAQMSPATGLAVGLLSETRDPTVSN